MEEEGIPACPRGYREVGYGVEEARPREYRLGDVSIVYVDGVYMPSHDSYILLDTLKNLATADRGPRPKSSTLSILEIGSGTGYVTVGLVKSLGLGDVYAVMADIDPKAAYASWLTSKANGVDAIVDVVQCDSSTCIRSKSVDLVYFNPPYLPVCDDMPEAIAWSGGEGGLEVWLRFFSGAVRVCREGCSIAYTMSTLQNLGKMFRFADLCSHIEIAECQSFFYETICCAVLRCP